MTEIKVTINAPELSEALGALARALSVAHSCGCGDTCKAETASSNANKKDRTGVRSVCDGTESSSAQADRVAFPTVPTREPTNATPAQTPVAPASAPVAPASAPVVAPAQTVVPTGAPTYTLDAIARAGTALLDAGKMNELTELLKKYGADTLVTINPTYYGAVAADLRALGAQI